jgi:hypothetical protein
MPDFNADFWNQPLGDIVAALLMAAGAHYQVQNPDYKLAPGDVKDIMTAAAMAGKNAAANLAAIAATPGGG